MWTHEAYIVFLRALGYVIPIIFLIVLGFRLECVTVDVLHALDQGYSCHIVANVIWHLAVLRNCFGGSTYAERIKRCSANLKEWYKTIRCKYKLQGQLTAERVRPSGDWPKLLAKAAHTHYLARYARCLMVQFWQIESLDEFSRLRR